MAARRATSPNHGGAFRVPHATSESPHQVRPGADLLRARAGSESVSGACETIEAGRPRTAYGRLLGPGTTVAARASDPRLLEENRSRGSGPCREHVRMLRYSTGSSCSGKTTLALAAARRIPCPAIDDVDEPGAPPEARREHWIQHALECQRRGTDLLLAGQAPLGEILAAPSAPRLHQHVKVTPAATAPHRTGPDDVLSHQRFRWSGTGVAFFADTTATPRAATLDAPHATVVTACDAPSWFLGP